MEERDGADKDYDANGYTSTANDEARLIVRNGDMSLVVEDITQAVEDITQMSLAFGGYVVSSYIYGEEEEMRGWISFRVPDEKFETALEQLRDMAVRVESESTSSQDVTEEYIDLQARLGNAEATEQQYLALLDKAEEIEDILRIYDYLSRIRSEIEQLKAAYRLIYRRGLIWREVLEALAREFPDEPAAEFFRFFSAGTRGFTQERRCPPGATIKLHRAAHPKVDYSTRAG